MKTYTEQEWRYRYRAYEGAGSISPSLVLVEWSDPSETPTEAIIRLNREVLEQANRDAVGAVLNMARNTLATARKT